MRLKLWIRVELYGFGLAVEIKDYVLELGLRDIDWDWNDGLGWRIVV